MKSTSHKRNPLLPWFISLPIVFVAVAYVGYPLRASIAQFRDIGDPRP
jgi:hypothetical protein